MRFSHTRHAVERYRDMGITPGLVEEIVEHPRLTYPSGQRPGQSQACTTAISDRHPKYAVVFQREDDLVRIVTVTFRTDVDYDRDGTEFVPKGVRR